MKRKISFAILSLYEIIRIIFFCTARPETSITLLPLSWFVAISALCMPVLFLFIMFFLPQYEKPLRFFYCLQKALSMMGMAVYALKDIPIALHYGAINNFYSFRLLSILLIFFLFDGIVLTISIIKRNPEKNED